MDADQVVRTDMGELYDMDLKGKPLAYTPFCDNNKEMDGYRFWRQVNAPIELIFIYLSIIVLFHCSWISSHPSVDAALDAKFLFTLFLCHRVSGRIICGGDHIILG